MNSDDKIYSALKYPLSNRKDDLGNIISNNVNTIVQELKSQNMSQDELLALKSCYEAAYQDSMGSVQIIVSLVAFFAGIDIFGDFPFRAEIQFLAKFILLLLWFLYLYCKIKKLSKENASLRNHIMAVSILLSETKQ